MKILIVGAGIAGQVAAHLLQQHHEITVIDINGVPTPPPSILRMPTPALRSAIRGITLRKVTVVRDVLPYGNRVRETIAYARKVTGHASTDRSIANLEPVSERYIFTEEDRDTLMGIKVRKTSWDGTKMGHDLAIVTIPLPRVLDILGLAHPAEFRTLPGAIARARVAGPCTAHATLYIPSPHYSTARAHVCDHELILEAPGRGRIKVEEAESIAKAMGVRIEGEFECHTIPRLKMLPIDEDVRRRIIIELTDRHGIYLLGRYATWRPKLMTDDLAHDVERIMRMAGSSNYQWR